MRTDVPTPAVGTEWTDINLNCVSCAKSVCVRARSIDIISWKNGEHAQNAFPYLSSDQKEMLISGFCDACWNTAFQEEDDDCLYDKD